MWNPFRKYIEKARRRKSEKAAQRAFFASYFKFGLGVWKVIKELDDRYLLKRVVENPHCEVEGLTMLTTFDFDGFHIEVTKLPNTKWTYLVGQYGDDFEYLYSVKFFKGEIELSLDDSIKVWEKMRGRLLETAGMKTNPDEVQKEIEDYLSEK